MSEEKFRKFYESISQQVQVQYDFKIMCSARMEDPGLNVVLFGAYHNMNAPNYGSDVQVRVIPKTNDFDYESLLHRTIHNPILVDEVEVNTRGLAVIYFSHTSVKDEHIKTPYKFSDKILITADMMQHDQHKIIGPNNELQMQIFSGQMIDITIRGRQFSMF